MGNRKGLWRVSGTEWLLPAFLTVVALTPAVAQVHIRENVVISPVQLERTQAAGVVTRDLRFVFAWDKGGGCSYLYIPGSPCGTIPAEDYHYYPDSMVIDLPAGKAGQYIFDPQYCVASINPWDVANVSFSIYVDNVLVNRQTARIAGSEYDVRTVWPNGWIYFNTPYYSDFDFWLQSEYFYGDPYVPHMSGKNTCDSTAWSPADPVTCTIVSGGQYASFHEANPQTGADSKIGLSITATGNSLGNFSLVFDGVLPDSTADWIAIEATSDGLTKIDSVQIPGRPVVTVEPAEISAGDTATVNVQWQAAPGGFMNFFEAGIISGENYGTLWDGWSDTASYFGNSGSQFYFIAASSIDSDSVTVGIRVGAELAMLGKTAPGGKGEVVQSSEKTNGVVRSGASKASAVGLATQGVKGTGTKLTSAAADDFVYRNYGVGWVKVMKQQDTIIFNIPAQKQEWPTLPAASGGNPNERNVKYFSVTVMRGTQPIPDFGVTLTASMILPSGGHSHTNQPPLDEMGEFEDYVNNVDGNGAFTTTTDENGEINVAYTAPEFSGKILITATSTAENVKSKDSITVEVPGLVPIGGGANLITYTSTQDYHKLEQSDYGTPATNALILDVVKQYADEYGMENDIYLAAIDMSLPWGGLFDIKGDWNPPHSLHRVGKSVDFSKWYRDASGEVTPVDIYVDGKLWMTTNLVDQETLDSYFKQAGFKRLERNIGKIHYESSN